MRVLITGATGFLGSHLSSYLADDLKCFVAALVRDGHTWSEIYDDISGEMVEVYGDLSEVDLLERVLHEYYIDTIFHLASQTQVRISTDSPYGTFESNIRGTYSLLEACRRYGVDKLQRVVVASSDKAYGSQLCPYDETQPVDGEYPYDVSKSCADLLSRSYRITYGMPTVTVRCSNLYGPGDMNWKRLVPAIARHFYRDEAMLLHGNGEMKRDYLYVEDAVAGYLSLVNRPTPPAQAYNFGGGEPVSAKSIYDMARTITQVQKMAEYKAECPGEISHQWMDCTKAKSELNWEPQITLSEGLTRTLRWYQDYFRRMSYP